MFYNLVPGAIPPGTSFASFHHCLKNGITCEANYNIILTAKSGRVVTYCS